MTMSGNATVRRPLRFCMITTFYPPYTFGGDGIFVHHLSNELARRGHVVHVIHCVDAYRLLAGGEPATTADDHANVTVHGLKSPFGSLSPLATQQIGFPIFKSARIQQILSEGFDVIHFHNISLVGGPGILSYGRGIKLYTMHEYWLVCPTHLLFRFNREPCTERRCLTCTLTHRRPPQWWRYSGLLEASVKHVDAFITPSRFSLDVHRQSGLDVPIHHLPNFVPSTDDTPPEDANRPSDPGQLPYFLYVGRLETSKGPQTLIPVFRRYPRARLLIAGTGSSEHELRQLAAASVNIRFLGHQSARELRGLYEQAVAVIVPSVCFEQFPLVTIEAFRQQTPVVVRNRGGMREIVDDSGGGVAYDTDEDLVAAMDRLLADPSWRRDLGRRGHQAQHGIWSVEAHMQRYFALIDQIANRSDRPGHGSYA
jgi:glycosyltransferase involved in cell wall biosynthesis